MTKIYFTPNGKRLPGTRHKEKVAAAQFPQGNHPRNSLPHPRPRTHPARVQSKPSLLAWITCDGVHLDPSSGKHTILGVFSNIKARGFPVVHPYMVWFLTLTDVQPGKHLVRISLGLDPMNPAELLKREFESQSPVHRINLINEFRNLRFEQPGEYAILIEVDDEPILATSLTVS